MDKLGPAKVEELRHTWEFWARPNQLEPKGNDWDIWVALAGRGWGKTRAGAEWVRHRIRKGDKIVHCVAPTKGDVRKVMVEGDSGLLNVCWKGDKTYRGKPIGYPEWSPTNNTMTWENGAKAVFFSAEDPERLRGPQAYSAWCDELCAWRNAQETWDMLQFGLRLGKHPQVFITTTPKTTKLLRNILGDEKTVTSTGSTYDNSANLASTFLDAVKKTYEGTRLGRQELYAEILDEASGALWNRQGLAKIEIEADQVPDLNRIVVSIDPAITSNSESDMTGIVVAGVDVNGIAYVLADCTGRYTPQQWAARAVSLFEEYQADQMSNAVPGFSMTSKTRPLIVAKLEEFIRNNLIKIYSSRLLNEMKTFVWNSGRAEAMRSYNDDLIIACAVGCWVRDTALSANQRDSEYAKAFIGSITKSTNELDTRINGMIGTSNLKMKEDFNKQQAAYTDFPWLFKG